MIGGTGAITIACQNFWIFTQSYAVSFEERPILFHLNPIAVTAARLCRTLAERLSTRF